MTEPIESLSYAVRGRVLGKYLGQLALVLAVLAAAPLICSLVYGEYAIAWRYLLVIALLLAAALLARLPAPERIQTNEALCIIALAFVLTPLLMTIPLTAGGLAFMDALFEAVSGVTTTGLSTLGGVTEKPQSLLFGRAWMQWYGGLGIAVFSVALLMGHQEVTRQLLHSDSDSGEGLATTTRFHARRMLTVYVALTLLACGLLWLSGVTPFHALSHGLAGVSTGGFSSFNTSLGGLNGISPYLLMIFSLAGAISLPLYYRCYRNGPRELFSNLEMRALLMAVLAGCTILLLLFHFSNGMSWGEAARHGVLMGISAQSTTGFSSLEVASLSADAKLAMILSMTIGGSVGSTAGGVKILRLLILLRLLQLLIRRTALPTHAVAEPQIGERRLEEDEIIRALLLIALFILVILLSWWPFVLAGHDPLDALFEVVSATGTVGLSTGIASAGLATHLKLILCLDMWLGRLEILVFLVLLYPRTWIGKRKDKS